MNKKQMLQIIDKKVCQNKQEI